jgi:hypothetical protein
MSELFVSYKREDEVLHYAPDPRGPCLGVPGAGFGEAT